MTDKLSERERSILMSKVQSGDTKPEWILRCGLHRLGFRYRLKDKRLPGRPDLVFPKYRSVVFVHGCFWHRHAGCKNATFPKSNVDFWTRKFEGNRERDRKREAELRALGWRVRVVWECQLRDRTVETIADTAAWLEAADAAGAENAGEAVSYDLSSVNRGDLLKVAEEKVRYRIDRLGKK
jgi:DNA mismatch endonuclease, patch repair protein